MLHEGATASIVAGMFGAHLAAKEDPFLVVVSLGLDHLRDGLPDQAGASGDHHDFLGAHGGRILRAAIPGRNLGRIGTRSDAEGRRIINELLVWSRDSRQLSGVLQFNSPRERHRYFVKPQPSCRYMRLTGDRLTLSP